MSPRRILRTALAVAALGAVLGGCGEEEREAASSQATPDPALTTPGTPEPLRPSAPPLRAVPEAVRRQLDAGAVGVVGIAGRVSVRPARLDIAKDATLVDLRWSRWGSDRAVGRGGLRLLECDPSCAKGETVTYRARVELSDPKACPTGLYFDRSQVTASGEDGPLEPAAYVRAPC